MWTTLNESWIYWLKAGLYFLPDSFEYNFMMARKQNPPWSTRMLHVSLHFGYVEHVQYRFCWVLTNMIVVLLTLPGWASQVYSCIMFHYYSADLVTVTVVLHVTAESLSPLIYRSPCSALEISNQNLQEVRSGSLAAVPSSLRLHSRTRTAVISCCSAQWSSGEIAFLVYCCAATATNSNKDK